MEVSDAKRLRVHAIFCRKPVFQQFLALLTNRTILIRMPISEAAVSPREMNVNTLTTSSIPNFRPP